MRITRALAFLNTNRLDESLAELNFTISHAPRWAIPYSYRSAVYMAKADFKKALSDSRKAVAIDPKDALAYNNLGVCFSRLKMFPNAQQAFEKMVLIERNVQGFAGPLARFNLGRCYQRQNQLPRANRQYDQTLIADPEFSLHMFEKSATAAQSGFRDQEIKNSLSSGKLPAIPFVQLDCLEDSATLLTRKMELVPRNSSSGFNRAFSYACLNNSKEAASDFDQFINKGDEDRQDRAIMMAYLCYERANQKDLAKNLLRANLEKIKNRSLSSLAHFLLDDGIDSKVVKETGSIVGDTIIHCDLGYYYLTRGDRNKAKPHIEWVLLNGDRKSAEYLLALTELERMCGRRQL
jgi:Tfp pilus assembly protein PilF